MKRVISTLCLFFLFQCVAHAQLELKIAQTNALLNAHRVRVFGDLIIFDPVEGKQVTSKQVAAITCTGIGDDAGVLFKFYHFEDGGKVATSYREVEPGKYIVDEGGKHWVEVTVFEIIDGKPKLQSEEASFEVGFTPEPDPEPDDPDVPDPPGPTPDVGPDEFDNIGQRVAGWTEGLPSNLSVGVIYKNYATLLRIDPRSIKQLNDLKNDELKQVTEYSQYGKMIENINADLLSRIGDWGDGQKYYLANYWEAIARGLGVK